MRENIWDRTAGTGQLGLTLGTGHFGQDSRDRTVSTGRPDAVSSWAGQRMTGLAGHDSGVR